MKRTKLFVFLAFAILSASWATGQEHAFHADNLVVSDEPGLILGIPAWAVKGDTNLSWIRKEQLLSNGMKTKSIRALCQTDPLFAALDTIYEMYMAGFQKMRYFNAILSFCGDE